MILQHYSMKLLSKKRNRGTALTNQLNDLTRYSEIKRLVYKISALQKQKRFRSLAVLSACPSEGKTLFCATLAIAYAETCQSKVLIVDTTTRRNPKSLNLKECQEWPFPRVDMVTLTDLQRRPEVVEAEPTPAELIARDLVLDTDGSYENSEHLSVPEESDQELIRRSTQEGVGHYGLILLDTEALTAQNKSNIDPLLVAHMSDASLLVVSRKLLDAKEFNACAKTLSDPMLHLIGMISNEEFPS